MNNNSNRRSYVAIAGVLLLVPPFLGNLGPPELLLWLVLLAVWLWLLLVWARPRDTGRTTQL